MIKSSLREVAAKFGIENGYQFQKFTGLTVSQSYSLWRDNWKSANLKTLNTLCNLFKCTPNDLIKFEPDKDFFQ
jgi:DNA-binding Xre family transcriptional regulator